MLSTVRVHAGFFRTYVFARPGENRLISIERGGIESGGVPFFINHSLILSPTGILNEIIAAETGRCGLPIGQDCCSQTWHVTPVGRDRSNKDYQCGNGKKWDKCQDTRRMTPIGL